MTNKEALKKVTDELVVATVKDLSFERGTVNTYTIARTIYKSFHEAVVASGDLMTARTFEFNSFSNKVSRILRKLGNDSDSRIEYFGNQKNRSWGYISDEKLAKRKARQEKRDAMKEAVELALQDLGVEAEYCEWGDKVEMTGQDFLKMVANLNKKLSA